MESFTHSIPFWYSINHILNYIICRKFIATSRAPHSYICGKSCNNSCISFSYLRQILSRASLFTNRIRLPTHEKTHEHAPANQGMFVGYHHFVLEACLYQKPPPPPPPPPPEKPPPEKPPPPPEKPPLSEVSGMVKRALLFTALPTLFTLCMKYTELNPLS